MKHYHIRIFIFYIFLSAFFFLSCNSQTVSPFFLPQVVDNDLLTIVDYKISQKKQLEILKKLASRVTLLDVDQAYVTSIASELENVGYHVEEFSSQEKLFLYFLIKLYFYKNESLDVNEYNLFLTVPYKSLAENPLMLACSIGDRNIFYLIIRATIVEPQLLCALLLQKNEAGKTAYALAQEKNNIEFTETIEKIVYRAKLEAKKN